jgi:1,4-alpha-glucan branching enzyme
MPNLVAMPCSIPGELDLHLFAEGKHRACADFLGAHVGEEGGRAGVRFAVWAPNAARVSVVGTFCDWSIHGQALRRCGESGVWFGFVAGLAAHAL